jgi:hypothetical protein
MKGKPLKAIFQCAKNSREVFVLRIRDEASSLTFLEAEIDPRDLINALTGRADMPMEFTLESIDVLALVGKVATFRSIGLDKDEVDRRERPFRHLDRRHPHAESLKAEFRQWVEAAAIKAAQAADGDAFRPGWKLRHDGTGAQQNGDLHQVGLVRYDDPETPTPETP